MIFLDANGKKYKLPKGRQIYWRISAYALVIYNKKILVVVPTWSPLYELPGGGVEKNESIFQGIIRECYEETGYKIKIKDKMPFYFAEQNFYHKHFKKFYHSLIIVYKGALINKKQNKNIINTCDGDEIKTVEWQDINKLNKNNTHPVIYAAIKKCTKVL